MINIAYLASSGNSYNLQLSRMVRIKEANFHEYEWEYDGYELRYGSAITRFIKSAVEYEAKLYFYGSRINRREQIEALHADFERDITAQTPGRLIWGDCYIDVYAMKSSTYAGGNDLITENDVTFFCPYPFWIQEKKVSVVAIDQESLITETDKAYTDVKYGYPYSYTIKPTSTWLSLDYYADCDFRLIAYGPFSTLYVTIGGNVYNIDYAADASEYIVIDNRAVGNLKGQAYLVRANGEKVNVFDYRNPLYSLFEKIKAGNITISYSRTYGIDLTLFMERSEPVGSGTTDDYATILNDEGAALLAKLGD